MNIKISTTNSKLGYQIPSISLLPQCSCRKDAPCARLCYGKRGNFAYKPAQQAQKQNFDCYIENSNNYFHEIISFLNDALISYKFFRWHTVGDIVDNNYLLGMIKTAKKSKQVKFLCFTKKFDLINNYLNSGAKIPSNLKIVFSAWDKSFKVNNPYNFPVAYVYFRKEDLNPDIPALAIPCKGHCPDCLACWDLKPGQSVFFNQH